jgi:hypothetical protein
VKPVNITRLSIVNLSVSRPVNQQIIIKPHKTYGSLKFSVLLHKKLIGKWSQNAQGELKKQNIYSYFLSEIFLYCRQITLFTIYIHSELFKNYTCGELWLKCVNGSGIEGDGVRIGCLLLKIRTCHQLFNSY